MLHMMQSPLVRGGSVIISPVQKFRSVSGTPHGIRVQCGWLNLAVREGQKHCATTGSHVIPQRSTGVAQPSLTSVIGREPVLYRWYERSMPKGKFNSLINSCVQRGTDAAASVVSFLPSDRAGIILGCGNTKVSALCALPLHRVGCTHRLHVR